MAFKTKAKQLETIITDATVISNITNPTNWTDANVYTGSITGLDINQYFYDGSKYHYSFDGTTLYRLLECVGAFGELYENSAGTTINLTVANQWYGWVTAGAGEMKLFSYQNNATADKLVVLAGGAGDYMFNFAANFKLVDKNTYYYFGLFKNGNPITKFTVHLWTEANLTDDQTSITGIVPGLVTGDTLDIRFYNTTALKTLITYNVNLSLTRINRE